MRMDAAFRKVFRDWPAGYHTKSHWKYEWDRRIKKESIPVFVETEDGQIPVYHLSQTYGSTRKRSELLEAKHEFLRRFWLLARHDRYLLCDNGTSTIDYHAQHERGKNVPWFTEGLMVRHLLAVPCTGFSAASPVAGDHLLAPIGSPQISTFTLLPVEILKYFGSKCVSSCGHLWESLAARSSSLRT